MEHASFEAKQGQCAIQPDDTVACGLEIARILPTPAAKIEEKRPWRQQRQPIN